MLVYVQAIDSPRESGVVTVAFAPWLWPSLRFLAIVEWREPPVLQEVPSTRRFQPVKIAGLDHHFLCPHGDGGGLLIIAAVGAMTLTHSTSFAASDPALHQETHGVAHAAPMFWA